MPRCRGKEPLSRQIVRRLDLGQGGFLKSRETWGARPGKVFVHGRGAPVAVQFGVCIMEAMLSCPTGPFEAEHGPDETTPESNSGENMSREDFQFLMRTRLLDATPDKFKRRVISAMTSVRLKSGERFIYQGRTGNRFYVIQHGTCIVSLEKDGQSHPLARD